MDNDSDLAAAWRRVVEELQPNQQAWVRASEPVTLHGNTAIIAVADDFTHALGDPAEARLAAALQYRGDGTCPPPPSSARPAGRAPLSAVDGHVVKPPWLENRIYLPR